NGPVSPAPSTSRASSQSGSRPAVSVPTQDRPEPVAQAPNLSSTRGGSHQSGQHPAVARALRGETSRQQVEDRSVRDRILLPAIIAGAGIALSIVHGLYAAQTGEVPAIGPVRVGWIAGLLVVLGILIGVLRFTRPRA